MKLQKILEELQSGYLCDNAYEFSTAYLGKCKSYYSVIKSTGTSPSITTLSVLEAALLKKADEFKNSKFEVFTVRRNKLLGLRDKVKEMRHELSLDKLNDYAI